MAIQVRPHDLIWLNAGKALMDIHETWVDQQWHMGLPVVVRRATDSGGRIPIGVRGAARSQRAAGWVQAESIVRVVTPEMLAVSRYIQNSPFVEHGPVQAAMCLAAVSWPWVWGVTGSTGYALATGENALQAASDLDLLIRAPLPLSRESLVSWQEQIGRMPCRVDTQIETPAGAFALTEWLCSEQVLLKTAQGPQLTSSPWSAMSS